MAMDDVWGFFFFFFFNFFFFFFFKFFFFFSASEALMLKEKYLFIIRDILHDGISNMRFYLGAKETKKSQYFARV